MSKAEWDALQRRLPAEDRTSYASYLAEQGVTTPPVSRLARGESGTIQAASIARQQEEVRREAVSQPMDIASQRYTAAAKAAGVTPTTTSTAITPNASTSTVTQNAPRTQQLPEGFTPGGWSDPTLIKFFGTPGADVMGYRLDPITGKDGKTYYRLSVANKGAYGEGVTGYSTFGALLQRGPNGEWMAANPREFNAEISGTSGTQTDFSAQQAAKLAAEEKRRQGQSAYNLLLEQFSQYGLGALVQPLQDLIVQGLSAAEFTLRLRDTDAYKKRFAANQQRINRGLRALSEAEYIGLEDQYQNVMRNYGLPANYYTRGDMGRQEGFERFIAGDVSAA